MQIFVKSMERFNSPVYFAPPCISHLYIAVSLLCEDSPVASGGWGGVVAPQPNVLPRRSGPQALFYECGETDDRRTTPDKFLARAV